MNYRIFLSAAIILSPWVFSLPTVGDWARLPKEQAVLGLLAFLPAWALWRCNPWFSALLGYLNLSCMFRSNPDIFTAWITFVAYSCLYLFLQRIRDDFLWLKKSVAISFSLALAYGALQLFNFHPILNLVNAAIKYEGELFTRNLTRQLQESGKLAEGEVVVEGKDYLKKIVYQKTGDNRLEAQLIWEMPTAASPHLRVNGMFGNPNDWICFVAVASPFALFALPSRRFIIAALLAFAMIGAVIAIKYMTPGHANVEARPATSLEIRITIYKEILEQWREHWLLGHGLGTFKTRFPQNQKMKTYGDFTYAHNDYLQFLYEAGLTGLLLLAGTLAHPLRRLAPWDRDRKIFLASLILFGACALFNFPAHSAPTALVAFISFCLLSRTLQSSPSDNPPL